MPLGELAALAAALCWTIGPLIATPAVREIGSVAFSRTRLYFFAAFLGLATLVTGGFGSLSWTGAGWLVASGVIGLALGDSALFHAYRVLGPRLGSLLYMTAAPFTALLAWLILGEVIEGQALVGAVLTLAGIAIALARKEEEKGFLGGEPGKLLGGVAAALFAALCQAVGALLSKPVLAVPGEAIAGEAGGIDPVAASWLRAVGAVAVMTVIALARGGLPAIAVPVGVLKRVALAALFGGAGMALMMVALSLTTAGIAAILTSLPPILMLPILFFAFRTRISWAGWGATALATLGVCLIVLR